MTFLDPFRQREGLNLSESSKSLKLLIDATQSLSDPILL